MSDSRPPLAPFDEQTIAAVASERELDPEALESLIERHQSAVRDLPGVEDIVYEWRSQFHEDPVVLRTDSVYVLAHRGHVWDEFVESLELTDGEATALLAVHDRQARALVDDGSAGRFETDTAMVLTRP